MLCFSVSIGISVDACWFRSGEQRLTEAIPDFHTCFSFARSPVKQIRS